MVYMADNAFRAANGWYMYFTYCQLDIRHEHPAEFQILDNCSAVLVSKIKSDAGHLSHDAAAMPQDEVGDNYQPVTPHMKGYISEQHVQTNIQVFDVYDDETDGCSFPGVFARTPEQQIYEEERQESAHAPKCVSKPICSHQRPTGSIFSFTNEKNLILNCWLCV
jgi:hypothetical protein